MNKKVFLVAILLGILVTAVTIFGYQYYKPKKTDQSSLGQKIAMLNTEVVSFGSPLKLGVYKIEGYYSTISFQPDYVGEVSIAKNGPVYTLEWRWQGDARTKREGIGILEGDILSVGFVDATSYGDIEDVGIISYRIIDEEKLEGKFSSFITSFFWAPQEAGREILSWQGELSKSFESNFSQSLLGPRYKEPEVCGPYSDEVVTGSLMGGSVWGSQPYTDDSDFNRAVVHTGLVSPGETVTIRKINVGYLYDFPGSTRNGVTTSSWTTGWCGVEIGLVE